MGKDSSQETQQRSTTTTNVDPRYSEEAYRIYGDATNAIQNYRPVSIPTPLSFNSDQLAAQDAMRSLALNNPAQPYLNNAAGYVTSGVDAAMGYRPMQITAPVLDPAAFGQMQAAQVGAPGQINAAQAAQAAQAQAARASGVAPITAQNASAARMTQEELNRYVAMQDPAYTNAVLDASLNDLNRGRQMAQINNQTAAAQAGAFGGTRQAVLEAETNRGFADAAARTAADLRLNAFNQAQQNYQADLARTQQTGLFNAQNQLAANQSNQQASLATSLANAGYANQANLANAGYANQANLANAGFQQQANLANAEMQQQANLANAGFQQQAGLANLQSGQNFALQNAQMNLAAQQANQQAAYAAANLGLTGSLAGAQAMTSLGGLQNQYALQGAGLLNQVGNTNYDLNAAIQDVNYRNQQQEAQLPLQQMALQQVALGSVPYGTVTNSDGTQTTVSSPSTFSSVMGGLGMLSSLGGMFASDRRLKRNIRPMRSPLSKLHRLNGVSYNWRRDGARDLGFIAQNVHEVLPEAAADIGGVKHISLPGIVGLLTESVKELDRKVSRRRGTKQYRRAA